MFPSPSLFLLHPSPSSLHTPLPFFPSYTPSLLSSLHSLLPSLHPSPTLPPSLPCFPLSYTPTLLFLSSLPTPLPYSSSISPLLPPLLPPSSHTQIDAHQDDANAVTFADESSQIIFSGGDDGICKVWDRRTLSETHCSPVGILAGHKDGITFIDTKVCLPPHTHTHTLTQCTLSCSYTHTHMHSLSHTHIHMHSLMHTCTHSLTHALTHPCTHPCTHSLTHALTHTCTHPCTHHTCTHSHKFNLITNIVIPQTGGQSLLPIFYSMLYSSPP